MSVRVRDASEKQQRSTTRRRIWWEEEEKEGKREPGEGQNGSNDPAKIRTDRHGSASFFFIQHFSPVSIALTPEVAVISLKKPKWRLSKSASQCLLTRKTEDNRVRDRQKDIQIDKEKEETREKQNQTPFCLAITFKCAQRTRWQLTRAEREPHTLLREKTRLLIPLWKMVNQE